MILAIDYGKVRVGLAISEGLLAQPVKTILNKSWAKLSDEIKEICKKNGVGTIVFGLPLNADGSESEMCNEVKNFSKRFAEYKVVLFDERFSSIEAEGINKKKVDQTAAAVILQRYIDSGK